ncbi:ATP-binding protein [uncultured Zhongshania sp.]|uniref:PAS domain-containing hybrid sensor histidine kinase/response regulator n=1 Tax=uncultured Zhongshania sp. TaxID=1642288 RepID=UPI0030D6E238|tara:strand:- start:15529 stop:18309 length:2781 start_codon:yes stop_codon:yes gene_type:complete
MAKLSKHYKEGAFRRLDFVLLVENTNSSYLPLNPLCGIVEEWLSCLLAGIKKDILMRDWIESREAKLSTQKHRTILNTAIVVLSALMFILFANQAYVLNRLAANSSSGVPLSLLQQHSAALMELDNVLARGNVIQEFATAYIVNDKFQADIIRNRLLKGQELLMGDVLQQFSQPHSQEIMHVLDLYISYQAEAVEPLAGVPVPLNPQVDSKKLLDGLQRLWAKQQEAEAVAAASVIKDQLLWRQQSQLVLTLLFLCMAPLIAGIYVSRKFAREHQDMLCTRAYFNSLVYTLPGIAIITNRNGEIFSVSQSAAEFLKYSRDDLSRMQMTDILPKRFRQQYELYCRNYLDTSDGRGTQYIKGRELLVLNADDEEIPVELRFGDFDSDEGEVLVVCLQDVSERRHLYQQYEHAQKRFEMAMMASRDGLWDWDLTTDSVFFSAAWLSMIGIRGGQPLDGHVVFEDSIHPEDRPRVKEAIRKFINSDQTLFRDEHRLRRRDGTICDAVTRACAQRDSSGQVIRIVGMHSDVTHFKETEREVRRLNRNLEDRVRLRTQQLETALLRAEAANRTKATFLAVMGHEIRTPMNGIIGMADLLSKTKVDQEQWMMVDTVRRSSESLLGTLDNILDYSALDSGDVEMEAESIQLVEFVEGVADEFAERASKNKLRFILHVDPSVPTAVFADAPRLRKILINLLDNAMKFTNSLHGEGLVQLRLKAADSVSEPRQRVEFEVIDNGVGVSQEIRKQLFKPFMFEENSRARRFGGTGLGLAISTRLLGLMGGEISLDDQHKNGSRFVFTIPFTVDTTSKRIPIAEGVGILACLSNPLLKASVHAALALGGQDAYWLSSTAELAARLSMANIEKTVLILAEGESSDLAEFCSEHGVRIIYISPRPLRIQARDPHKVYSDPVLPSALTRAVEYRPRLAVETF